MKKESRHAPMHKEEYMSHKGHTQGDMSPVVEQYQAKDASYAGHQAGKTVEYIERTDRRVDHDAGKVRSNSYKGRYD